MRPMGGFFDRLLDRLDGLGRRAARSPGGHRGDGLDRVIRSGEPGGLGEPRVDPGLGARFRDGADPVDGAACPSCGDVLSPLGDDVGSDVLTCGHGCGFFATAAAMKKLESDPNFRRAVQTSVGEVEGCPEVTRVQYRRCPACGDWTQRLNYMRVSGVMVDFCLRHGVWCDAGELSAMIAFLDAGGSERGARFEQDNRAYVRRVRASTPTDDWGFGGG